MSRLLVYTIVFIEGFSSLGAEVIALRRLVPHVGSSIVVTAPTIGFFLLALALGYASGARVDTNYRMVVARNFLIAALLAERTPSVFDGVLALCGPYGSFAGQVDYIGDFRVLFDYYFPGLMPPTPVDIPDSLLATWETETYSTTIKPVIDDPTNSATVQELLNVGGVAYSPTDPTTREHNVEHML